MVDKTLRARIQRLEGDMTKVEQDQRDLERAVDNLEERFNEHKKRETP